MRSSVLIGAALGAIGSAAAQSSSATPTSSASPSGTSTAPAQTHTVDVAKGGTFMYSPAVVNASAGDYITWNFYPGGHTVVRGAFQYPCIPSNMSTTDNNFFFSGKDISPPAIVDPLPQFTIRINDTKPIFYYCSAPGSCVNQHMIGVINPSENETFAEQMTAVEDPKTIQINPGDPWPSEEQNPFTTTASSTPSATGTPSPSNTAAASTSGGGSALSGGAIAGIAIGGAAVLILAAALIYICGLRGGQISAYRRSGHWGGGGHQAPMEEARYPGGPGSQGPGSPGANTFNSSQYQRSPGQESFNPGDRQSPTSQYVGSPPPMSPGSHPAYGAFNQAHSPLMGGSDDGRGYYDQPPQETPPPKNFVEAAPPEPVELPSSQDPGNSPIPGYQPPMRQLSWAQGAESNYRPDAKR